MKKIVCFIDSLSSGGAQRQLVGLAGLLKDKGYQVKVITYHDIPFYKPLLDLKKIEFEYVRRANNKWLRIYYISKAIKQYRTDLVIAYLDPCAIITCIIKIFGGKYKLIVSERNTTQRLNCKERLKFFLYRKADYIVPNSYSQKNFITNHFPKLKEKTITITNFVDTETFSPLKTLSCKNKPLQIIGVGRVLEQKNILRFLSALRLVIDNGIELHVKWYGEQFDYFQLCKSKVKELSLQQYIEFKGLNNSIWEEYRKADVFCLPSIYEGYPNVICEAMSCGLPILCSNVSDNPQIVKDQENGFLFNPLDVNDIAFKIEKFAKIPIEKRDEMGTKSRNLAISNFSKEAFISKYIQIIKSLEK